MDKRSDDPRGYLDEAGRGKCSVPMWRYPGVPAGYCEREAYGERPEPERYYRNAWTGEQQRSDGKYNGYVPRLACPSHGGPPSRVYRDGNMWCAVWPDFINLQESPSGFGETVDDARHKLGER